MRVQQCVELQLVVTLGCFVLSSGSFDPDLSAPPTPIPPKSAWQRRAARFRGDGLRDEGLRGEGLSSGDSMDSEMRDADTLSPSGSQSLSRPPLDVPQFSGHDGFRDQFVGSPMLTDSPLPLQHSTPGPKHLMSARKGGAMGLRAPGGGQAPRADPDEEWAAGGGVPVGGGAEGLSGRASEGVRTRSAQSQRGRGVDGVRSRNAIRKLSFDSPPPEVGRTPIRVKSVQRGEGLRRQSPKMKGLDEQEDDDFLLSPVLPAARAEGLRGQGARAEEGRVNLFATSPISPIHGSAPGSAGVGRMTRRLTHSTSFRRDFFDIEEMGRGEHGKVYKCIRKMDLWPYAVKVMQRSCKGEKDREKVLQEIYALAAQGDNPHVVRYFSAWEEDDVIHIQMELCSGTLAAEWQTSRPLDEARLRSTLAQASCALNYMHQHGIAHMDVKPSNLYTSLTGLIKLGDFGLATDISNEVHNEEIQHGDKKYLAQEVLERGALDLKKSDIFSLGSTLLELSSAEELPASGHLYHELREGQMTRPAGLSVELFALIRQMMHPMPAQRPTAEQILQSNLVRDYLPVESLSAIKNGSPMLKATAALQQQLSLAQKRYSAAEAKIQKLEAQLSLRR